MLKPDQLLQVQRREPCQPGPSGPGQPGLIGGSFGALVGAAAGRLFPSLHVSTGAFAVVGMAALFGACTRATFASIVFVFELTHDFNVVLPLMLASVLANLVAGRSWTRA